MLRMTGIVMMITLLPGCSLLPWWDDEALVRDQHGCLRSEGYRWSPLMERCLIPAEQAVRLGSLKYGDDRTAWVLVARDNSEAEVYLPERDAILLPRRNRGDKPMWESGDWSLLRSRGFVLSEDGHARFHNYGAP
ncbi:hypothetical protein [Aeromonas schubertii]|nr:hypothetical protein [Aeromonas schubertii]